jgi:DNA-binding PadR family transcriptional regulator
MGAGVNTDGSERRTYAMRSLINWAVLGLLIERPSYGYDLFHRFERTYGKALELSSPSQVYGARKPLKQKSLIEQISRDDAGAGEAGQPKPRYRATAEAVPAYRERLVTLVTHERERLELLALLVGALPPRDALVVVDCFERRLLSERTTAPQTPDAEPASARQLAEHAKQLETGQALKWTTYARRELEAAIDAQGAVEADAIAAPGDRVAPR